MRGTFIDPGAPGPEGALLPFAERSPSPLSPIAPWTSGVSAAVTPKTKAPVTGSIVSPASLGELAVSVSESLIGAPPVCADGAFVRSVLGR